MRLVCAVLCRFIIIMKITFSMDVTKVHREMESRINEKDGLTIISFTITDFTVMCNIISQSVI